MLSVGRKGGVGATAQEEDGGGTREWQPEQTGKVETWGPGTDKAACVPVYAGREFGGLGQGS